MNDLYKDINKLLSDEEVIDEVPNKSIDEIVYEVANEERMTPEEVNQALQEVFAKVKSIKTPSISKTNPKRNKKKEKARKKMSKKSKKKNRN